MADVDLHVVCKSCGAEVSPYITECPYCGNRLRKRAPKLQAGGGIDVAPSRRGLRELLGRGRGLRGRGTRGRKVRGRVSRERPEASLARMRVQRPYATIVLVMAGAAVYVVNSATSLGSFDLGAVVGPLDGDAWRLVTTQFSYDNVFYLFAVGVAAMIFGSSLERRYGFWAPVLVFLGAGTAGAYLATVAESFPVARGGNGSALGLLCAWAALDLRARRAGEDTDSDLLGAVAIALVLALMPLLDTTANAWAGLGGAAAGALTGLALPRRT